MEVATNHSQQAEPNKEVTPQPVNDNALVATDEELWEEHKQDWLRKHKQGLAVKYYDPADIEDEEDDWSSRKVNGQDKMFPESTHSYMIYYPDDPNPNGLIASIFVIILQFICYVVSVNAAVGDIKTAFLLPLKMFSANCDDGKPEQSDGGGAKVDAFSKDSIYELSCEAAYSDWKNDESKLLLSFLLTCILFVMFVQYDFFACIKVIATSRNKWSRLISLVILSESLFAFVAGVTFATVGVFQASSYAAISNLLGVLFVHDLDEKMFETTSLLDGGFLNQLFGKKREDSEPVKTSEDEKESCCKRYRPTCCMMALMLLCCVAGLILYVNYASNVVLDEKAFREYAEEEWGWEGYFDSFYGYGYGSGSEYGGSGTTLSPYGSGSSGGASTTGSGGASTTSNWGR